MTHSLSALRERCDAALERCLPAAADDHPLTAAMRYAVLGGGKRLRPLLVYAAGLAVAAPPERLDPAAVAIELIHAYSLVHDDLPAMDDDDLRRGRPTVHKAYDEATAILAGDALQTLAFEVLLGGTTQGIDPAAVLAQAQRLAVASGYAGMVGGQAVDLAMVGRQPDLASLKAMHAFKTGALIVAAVELGALGVGEAAAAVALPALTRYARDLGLAFQIQDDVLDEIGDSAETGKAVGADRERGKPTYTALLGIDAARDEVHRLTDAALAALDALDGDTRLLRELAALLRDRRA